MIQGVVSWGRRVAGMEAIPDEKAKAVDNQVTDEQRKELLHSTKTRLDAFKTLLEEVEGEKAMAVKRGDRVMAKRKIDECNEYKASIAQLEGEYRNQLQIREIVARADANRIQAADYIQVDKEINDLVENFKLDETADAVANVQANVTRLNNIGKMFSTPLLSAGDYETEIDPEDELNMLMDQNRLEKMETMSAPTTTKQEPTTVRRRDKQSLK